MPQLFYIFLFPVVCCGWFPIALVHSLKFLWGGMLHLFKLNPISARLLCLAPLLVCVIATWTHALGGLPSITFLVAGGALALSVGADRLVWVVWWIYMYQNYFFRLQQTLAIGESSLLFLVFHV